MTISGRIEEGINKYCANDLENALIQVCIAIDATSKNEYPEVKKVGQRFKLFAKKNLDIITFHTFYSHMLINNTFNGMTIEEFIYKVLRCGLLHEGEISKRFQFVAPGEPVCIGIEPWKFSKTFIFGCLLAVIGAQSNKKLKVSDSLVVDLDRTYKVNDIFGRSDLIRSLSWGKNA